MQKYDFAFVIVSRQSPKLSSMHLDYWTSGSPDFQIPVGVWLAGDARDALYASSADCILHFSNTWRALASTYCVYRVLEGKGSQAILMLDRLL